MKKITKVVVGVTSIALFTFGLIGMSQINANNKVRLHHGNQLIDVSSKAVSAHLRHGDELHLAPVCNRINCND